MAITSRFVQIKVSLRRWSGLHRLLRWLYQAVAVGPARLLATILRHVALRSFLSSPPRGTSSVLARLQAGEVKGQLVLRDQGTLPLPSPSLLALSKLRQAAEQPWPIFWTRHAPARLVGSSLALIDDTKSLCAEAVYGSRFRDDPAWWYIPTSRPCHLRGAWTSLISRFVPNNGPTNYAHWLLDALPRLALLDRFPTETGVLVPPKLLPFQVDTLHLLGLAQRLRPTAEQHLALEEYFFSAPQTMIVCYNPFAVEFLRSRFLECAQPAPITNNRFYIRRSGATRTAVDESQIADFFERLGWAVVDTAQLSFRQQVELFSRAEAVCGIHGAGFTNCVWASPGCKVIELCADAYLSGCFEWLCHCVRASHSFLVFPSDHALKAIVDLSMLRLHLRNIGII